MGVLHSPARSIGSCIAGVERWEVWGPDASRIGCSTLQEPSTDPTRRAIIGTMTASSSARASGGGAATQAGMSYQTRVAAWFYVRMLAGVLSHEIGEAPNLSIRAVRCETDQPIDDVLVEFSDHSRVLIQVKHGLASIGTGKQSAFSTVLRQFVRQTVLRKATQPSAAETMLLVVDPTASGSIKNDLRSLFDRFALAPEGALDAIPTNAREQELRHNLDEAISREWQEVTGEAPSTSDVEDLLRRSRVRVLDVDPHGSDERAARDLLQTSALTDVSAVEAAWTFTVEYASQAIAAGGAVDRIT